MSRGQQFAQFNAGARRYLDPDVGPAENDGCAVGACEDAAVYRVPWPEFGGDVAYCSFHLARYQHHHPDLFDRVQDRVEANLDALATRGQRWLALAAVPERIRSGRYRRVGVTARGYALFEQTEPDDGGRVTYVLVDRQLEYKDAIQVPSGRCGPFLEAFAERRGMFAWDPEVRAALDGGGRR